MICTNCGQELPEGSIHCSQCGTKIGAGPRTNQQYPVNQIPNPNQTAPAKTRGLSPMIKGIIIGAAFIVGIFALLLLIPDDKPTNQPAQTPAAKNAANESKTTSDNTVPTPDKAVDSAAPVQPADTSKKNGYDKTTFANGDTYEGNFSNGLMNGKGTYVKADGTKYLGDFLAGKITGQEVVYYTNGDVYEGKMVNGKREGSGKYLFANGTSYDGNWVAGKKQGRGVFRYLNGAVFEGSFVNDVSSDSNGKMTFPNGDIYEGPVNNGKLNGQATVYYNYGIYRGSIVDGKRDGYGRFEWENGDFYEGYWAYGKRNGQGTYYYGSGGRDFGTWENDVLVAAG